VFFDPIVYRTEFRVLIVDSLPLAKVVMWVILLALCVGSVLCQENRVGFFAMLRFTNNRLRVRLAKLTTDRQSYNKLGYDSDVFEAVCFVVRFLRKINDK
ncbi:MAG: hypothetical protein LBQ66_15330, partial [Planctomycetaceae bacterium]|jgi:hypothetical protein|nr:hypothetical protein [Planctomycetaceae bacterium]